MCQASVTSSVRRSRSIRSRRTISSGIPLVGRCGEEQVRFAEQQRLPFGLVADVQDGDVGAQHPALPGYALRIGPDEPAPAHPEVETVAADLLDAVEGEGEPPDVLRVSHRGTRLACARC